MTNSTRTWITSRDGVSSLDLILNDLSIHEQFAHASEFHKAIERVQRIRELARRFDREIYCHRETMNRMVTPSINMHDLIQTSFTRDQKRSLMTWLTKQGPFWDEVPKHDSGEWFECHSDVVSETALAEAAYCSRIDIQRGVVSLVPSEYEYTPIPVTWVRDYSTEVKIDVDNFWEPSQLEIALRYSESPIKSWNQLELISKRRFQRLTFTQDCFADLNGRPFNRASSQAIVSRLDVLNRLVGLIDETGRQTLEFRRLYEDNFLGDRAAFSDSSDSEKQEFRNQLTFRHPNLPREDLFCPMHGKVNQELIRIQFSWPISEGRLYVVYIGRKITTR